MNDDAGMEAESQESEIGKWAFRLLVASFFSVTFSIAAGETLLGLCFVLFLADFVRRRTWPRCGAMCWYALVFVIIAVCTVALGPNPEKGMARLPRLFWLVSIPLASAYCDAPRRLGTLLKGFALGCGVLSLEICCVRTYQTFLSWRAGESGMSFFALLIDRGSMTDGQMLMLGTMVLLGLLLAARRARRCVDPWGILLVLTALALVLNFKRGSWFCAAALILLFLLMRGRWKSVILVLLVSISAVALPPVRTRLATLVNEFDVTGGGRVTMWVKVAPAMIRDRPGGVGYGALSNEMMRRYAPNVEPRRDHLHSNVAQVLVETGWIGLLVYLSWMVKAVLDSLRLWQRERGRGAMPEMLAGLLFFMLLGLLGNGLVEYNFGDTELLIVYGIIMGCVAAGLRLWGEPSAVSGTNSDGL